MPIVRLALLITFLLITAVLVVLIPFSYGKSTFGDFSSDHTKWHTLLIQNGTISVCWTRIDVSKPIEPLGVSGYANTCEQAMAIAATQVEEICCGEDWLTKKYQRDMLDLTRNDDIVAANQRYTALQGSESNYLNGILPVFRQKATFLAAEESARGMFPRFSVRARKGIVHGTVGSISLYYPLSICVIYLAVYFGNQRRRMRRYRVRNNRCVVCAYDIRGNLSGLCPECGTTICEDQERVLKRTRLCLKTPETADHSL